MAIPKVKQHAIARGARAKLRAYFLAHLGLVLGSDELRLVAGNISE